MNVLREYNQMKNIGYDQYPGLSICLLVILPFSVATDPISVTKNGFYRFIILSRMVLSIVLNLAT